MNYVILKILSSLNNTLLCFSLGMFFFTESFIHASCASTFITTLKSKEPGTDAFIRYLSELYELGAITVEDIKLFLEHLKQGEILNPIAPEKANTSVEAQIQMDAINEMISTYELQVQTLILWSSLFIEHHLQNTSRQMSYESATIDTYPDISFYPIEVHRRFLGFEIPRFLKRRPVIEVASTPITQYQWFKTFGDNPSYHIDGPQSLQLRNKKNERVQMQPNHPVENFTIWSAMAYANALSELHNLQPVYDLSCLEFHSNTTAAKGNLNVKSYPRSNKMYLKQFSWAESNKTYLPNFDWIYTGIEGYRLPTEDEQSFLLGYNGQELTEKFYFGDDEKELKLHAWYEENSNNQTHEVAQLTPRIIQGFEFYDLLGNVQEIANTLPNPIYSKRFHQNLSSRDKEEINAKGGSYLSHADYMSLFYFRFIHQKPSRLSSTGLRLVRTLLP